MSTRRRVDYCDSFKLYRALLASVGTPLEVSARAVLRPMVVPFAGYPLGVMSREVGHRLNVSGRSATRLLRAFGWSSGQRERRWGRRPQ